MRVQPKEMRRSAEPEDEVAALEPCCRREGEHRSEKIVSDDDVQESSLRPDVVVIAQVVGNNSNSPCLSIPREREELLLGRIRPRHCYSEHHEDLANTSLAASI